MDSWVRLSIYGKNTPTFLFFNLNDLREERGEGEREWFLKTLVHWMNDK